MLQLDMSAVQRWGGLLGEEAAEIGARVEPAVAAQQAEVYQAIQTDIPVRTGLGRSTVRQTGKGMNRWVRAGSKKAFYLRFLEWGTKKMAARSFVRPNADESTHREFEDRVDDALARGPIYQP